MKAIYPAVLYRKENGHGYHTRVPDLPGCVTSGSDLADAVRMTADAAHEWLCCAEDCGDPIPKPSSPEAIQLEPGAIQTLIEVDTDLHRRMTDTRAVRKNVSLPAWMATLAERRGVNCSQVLQDALTELFER